MRFLKGRARDLVRSLKNDIRVVRERDPAARSAVEVVLCYPGVQAVWMYRIYNVLWRKNTSTYVLTARVLSYLVRWLTGIEIHPGAKIGHGVFIDHGIGVVIGETAEIGDNCLIYQGVTLGGTGKQVGKRHPTLGNNVVVGAGAHVLGAIKIGDNVRIGAGSVVLRDVGADCTVVGIPGRVIEHLGAKNNPLAHSELPDTEGIIILKLLKKMDRIEEKMNIVLRSLSDSPEDKRLSCNAPREDSEVQNQDSDIEIWRKYSEDCGA